MSAKLCIMQPPPIAWTFHDNNPVIRPGRLNTHMDARIAGAASVIEFDDAYQMYYWGSGAYTNCICAAHSDIDDPNDWRPFGSVVIPTPENKFNITGPRWPWALVDGDRILLYYCARGSIMKHPYPNHPWLIVSNDGGNTWHETTHFPLITTDTSYDKDALGSFCVIRVEDKFHMYYTAFSGHVDKPAGVATHDETPLPVIGIGFAISDDGMEWEKPYDDFIIEPRFETVDPYEYKVARPCVLKDGNIWRMWVSCLGRHYCVRSLWSEDSIVWHWENEGPAGAFGVGEQGSFDDEQRCYPAILKHNDEYRCWYTGNGFGATGIGYAVGRSI